MLFLCLVILFEISYNIQPPNSFEKSKVADFTNQIMRIKVGNPQNGGLKLRKRKIRYFG